MTMIWSRFTAPGSRFPLTALVASSFAVAACQQAAPPSDPARQDVPTPNTNAPAASVGGAATAEATGETAPPVGPPASNPAKTSLQPPAPGEVGGLPDDRTSIAEGKIDPKSPQGAAQRLQIYAALIEEGNYGEAYALWGDSGKASGMTKQQFADSFAKYSEVHAMTGAPQDPEGAAGSSYVTVPMQLYGRLKSGGTFNLVGPVTMRRVNDVPGATLQQLRWHISDSDLKPRGTVKEVPVK